MSETDRLAALEAEVAALRGLMGEVTEMITSLGRQGPQLLSLTDTLRDGLLDLRAETMVLTGLVVGHLAAQQTATRQAALKVARSCAPALDKPGHCAAEAQVAFFAEMLAAATR